jgi:hypothetical protein
MPGVFSDYLMQMRVLNNLPLYTQRPVSDYFLLGFNYCKIDAKNNEVSDKKMTKRNFFVVTYAIN